MATAKWKLPVVSMAAVLRMQQMTGHDGLSNSESNWMWMCGKLVTISVDIGFVEKPFQHTCLKHLQDCVVNGD